MFNFFKKKPTINAAEVKIPPIEPAKKSTDLRMNYNQIVREVGMAMLANRTGEFNLRNTSGNYDGADALHNVYEDFGYPDSLTFENYWHMYRRFGVAKAVVDIPSDLAWVSNPEIKSENQAFVDSFNELCEKLDLWDRLKGFDKRQRVGRYAGMYFQVKDGKQPDKELMSISGLKSIVKITLLYEGQLQVTSVESDNRKDNFDEPTMYMYKGNGVGNRNEKTSASFAVHPSRLVVSGEGSDDGTIYGVSELESIFNDLMDLRKISGAGGEGFYQNTRMAPVFTANDDFTDDEGQEDNLSDAIDDFLAKHRKRLVLRGITAQYPNIQLSNPEEFYQSSINNIAAGSKIPAAFLIGQQTGRLASDKDSRHLMTLVQSRREKYLTDLIKQVVDWFIKKNALPMAEYEICWGDLLTMSDGEKIEVVEKMAAINEKQSRAGGMAVFTVEEMRNRAGLDEEFDMEDLELEGEEEPESDPSAEPEGEDDNGNAE